MRVLAIGDIHGCSQALIALADAVKIRPDDVIVTLGDYIDRGPNSAAVLDWLITRSKTHKLVSLRGNHEIMMLRARDDESQIWEWLANGGDATLSSYSPFDDEGKLADVPDEHWDFLTNQCRAWYETDTHIFVHANAYADMSLEEQPEFMLFWEQFDNPPPHQSGKIMVCGHTPQKSGRPKNLVHAVCIDTWAHGKGWLTCLDTATGLLAGEPARGAKGGLPLASLGGKLVPSTAIAPHNRMQSYGADSCRGRIVENGGLMLTSVEGVYQNGKVELSETVPEGVSGRVIVTFVPEPKMRELSNLGIGPEEAAELRFRLSAFAEDWDRPEMDVYDVD